MIARLYRFGLRVYPRRFRDRFADDMTHVFEARLRDAQSRGRLRRVAFGALGLFDVFASGTRERFGSNSVVPCARRSAMTSESWLADVKFALRVLRRSPSMTAAS